MNVFMTNKAGTSGTDDYQRLHKNLPLCETGTLIVIVTINSYRCKDTNTREQGWSDAREKAIIQSKNRLGRLMSRIIKGMLILANKSPADWNKSVGLNIACEVTHC